MIDNKRALENEVDWVKERRSTMSGNYSFVDFLRFGM